MGTPSLFFILNPTFVHHPLLVVLIRQNINFYLFYDSNMLDKYEWCKQTTINPKVQAIFVHVLVNVIFKYTLQVNNNNNNNNTNTSVLGQIKVYYGCYETMKNGSLHIHTLLWFNDYQIPTNWFKCYITMKTSKKTWLII